MANKRPHLNDEISSETILVFPFDPEVSVPVGIGVT